MSQKAQNNHDLSHVELFLFDLDDVLYPHGSFLSPTEFWHLFHLYVTEHSTMSYEEAAAQTDKFIAEGGPRVDVFKAWDAFAQVKRKGFTDRLDTIELAEKMQPCLQTLSLLKGLKGRRAVFTNAHTPHAERILAHLQLTDVFEHVSDYMTRGDRLKPEPDIYVALTQELGVDPSKCVMIEDTAINLKPAHDLGMTTVYIHPTPMAELKTAPYVHRWHPTLIEWLESIKQ